MMTWLVFLELEKHMGYSGLKTGHKFAIQAVLGLVIGGLLYFNLGIDIINIPFLGTICFGPWFILLAAFLVITFSILTSVISYLILLKNLLVNLTLTY